MILSLVHRARSLARILGAAGAAAAVLVALLPTAGCQRSPKTAEDVLSAAALERNGERDEEAIAAWRAVGERACAAAAREREARRRGEAVKTPADPKDDCAVAKMREAQLLERLGRTREAEEAWEQVPARAADGRNAARALARASGLLSRALDEPDRAAEVAWQCVKSYPDHLGADDCLAVAVAHDRKHDARALRDRLDALSARFEKHDLIDNIRMAAAEVTGEELGDPLGAVRRYDEVATRFRRSSLRDDALWRAAHILDERGDHAGAIEELKRLLATRRRALITGSYNSVYLDDAQLWLGRILLDQLHDPVRASAAFAVLANDFEDSVLRDDALLELSRARLQQSDRAGACAALDRVLSQFPDGNQARAAAARHQELGCPGSLASTSRKGE